LQKPQISCSRMLLKQDNTYSYYYSIQNSNAFSLKQGQQPTSNDFKDNSISNHETSLWIFEYSLQATLRLVMN